MNVNEYIKMVQADCCVLNNLLARLKLEKEIELIPAERNVIMRFSPLFDDLHIDVVNNKLQRA